MKDLLKEKAKDFRVVQKMDNAQRQALLTHIAQTEYLLRHLFSNQSIAREFERTWGKFGLIEHESIRPPQLTNCASECADFLDNWTVRRKDINTELSRELIDHIVSTAKQSLVPERIELRRRHPSLTENDNLDIFKKFDELASRTWKIECCDDAILIRDEVVALVEQHFHSKHDAEQMSRRFKRLCKDPHLFAQDNSTNRQIMKRLRKEIADEIVRLRDQFRPPESSFFVG